MDVTLDQDITVDVHDDEVVIKVKKITPKIGE